MLNWNPNTSAVILTDDLFNEYGGDITLGSDVQRQAGYWLAEWKATQDLSTFLLPTIYSGTFLFSGYELLLDHNYVSKVYLTRFIDFQERVYYTISGTANIYQSMASEERGILDLQYLIGNCGCHSASSPYPYKVQVVYETGLPSGTSYRPNVLLALTTYATIILNEVIGYGNEAPGDIGVAEYSNQDYREKRKGLVNNTFGKSAKATFAHGLLTGLRKHRHVSL